MNIFNVLLLKYVLEAGVGQVAGSETIPPLLLVSKNYKNEERSGGGGRGGPKIGMEGGRGSKNIYTFPWDSTRHSILITDCSLYA